MSAPKSVIKVNKKGVQYVSSVDKCEYYLYELSRAAMRDVGKFLKKKFKEEYYKIFKRHTGDAGKATSYVAVSNKKTKYPRLEIGIKHATKGKEVVGYYAYFQEFGTKKTPKIGILTNLVQNNIAEIVKIESQYLSALENEARTLALINEDDYEDEE